MNLSTIILLAVLAVVVVAALLSSRKHMKGQGGCCGGGEAVVSAPEKKKLEGPVLGRKIIGIEGMHCENCKHTVERQINRIEGAACEVELKNKRAVVSYDRELSDQLLRVTIERLDYKVTDIRTEPA